MINKCFSRLGRVSHNKRLYLILLAVVSFIAIAAIAQKVLYNFPNSADEYAYVFQAKNLARLQTYHDIHPKNDFGEHIQNYFYLVHIGHTDGKYYGRFPFGYSLFMVPFAWLESLTGLKAYWITNAVFGVLSLLLLYQFGAYFYGRRVGVLASLMGLFSAWFLFNSGSHFSHTLNAFFIGCFLYAFCRALDSPHHIATKKWYLLAGFTFGLAVVTRFLDPLPFLLVVLILYLGWKRTLNRQTFIDVFHFALGGLCWLIILLLYNYNLTGEPLLTAYEYYNPNDQGTRFIFDVPQKDGTSIIDYSRILSIGYEKRTLPNVKLLFEWHIWAWLFLFAPTLLFLKRFTRQQKWLLGTLFLAPFLVIGIYLLYGGPPANQYGPRYYYSFIIPLTLVSAVVLNALMGNKRYLYVLPLIPIFIAAKQISTHIDKFQPFVYERTNLFRTIEENKLENAVVFLKTRSGTIHQVDLPRNALDFDNAVLIAQDNGRFKKTNQYGPLIRTYPDRDFYEYYYQGKNKLGKLKKLWTDKGGNWSYQEKAFQSEQVLYNVNGLIGRYYLGKEFNVLAYQKLDKNFDFKWHKASPAHTIPKDNFSVQWDGLFSAPESGNYTFTTLSDDGIRLMVNEKSIIEHWTPHSEKTDVGKIYLNKGDHPIKIQYYDQSFDARLRIEFDGPKISKRILDEQYLKPVIM